jgi:hypothetical protein
MWLALGAPGETDAKASAAPAAGDHAAKAAADGALPGVEEKAGPAAAHHAHAKEANSGADAQRADKPADAQKTEKPAADKKQSAKETPRPELPAELAALRDRVRYSLASYARQPLNTRDFNAGEILVGCLPFGCQTEVSHDGQSLNGITCLCWNYPCGGRELLVKSEGHVAARVGYGVQSYPGQMLAMLALSRVPADYPMRAGGMVKNVGDLVEYEKLACRAGTNQSLRLTGLAHYVPKDQKWKNSLGEDWSIERLVDDELGQPMATAPAGGTLRLVALSVAVARHGGPKPAPRSAFSRALEFVTEYQRYALQLQNSDGSWHPSILTATGSSNDLIGEVRASGYVLSWLAFSLPQDQLTKPEMVRGVEFLSQALGVQQARWNVGSLSRTGFDGLMQALNALVIYDLRVFKPFDPPAEEAKGDKEAKSAE